MSENSNNQIKQKVDIPKIRLWGIWLFMFVFPSIFTLICYEQLAKEYAYFARTDLIAESFEDIKNYNKIIAPKNFLNEQIKEAQNLEFSSNYNVLKADIDSILCGKTLFCIFFNENVDYLTIIKSEESDNKIKNMPVYFFKKHINEINKANKSAKDNIEEIIDTPSQKKFGIFLQQFFKTSTNISIRPNRVSQNFSIKFDGELYFILCNFTNPNKECSGFFAVLKGKDFSFQQMLKKLHKKYPSIKIAFKEVDVYKDSQHPENLYSGLKQDNKGLLIISPTSNLFSRHVLHGGGIELLESLKNLFPFIQYRIPLWKYQAKIISINKIIRIITILVIMFSATCFLRISLFGFSEKSFKNKILALIAIASIYPFGIFSFSIYSISKYQRFIENLQIQLYTENILQLHNRELEAFLIKTESNLVKFASNLSIILSKKDLKESEFSNYFNSIGEEIPVSSSFLYFNSTPSNLKNICVNNKVIKKYPDRISKMLFNDDNDAVLEQYLKTSLKLAQEIKPLSREREDVITVSGLEIDNQEINNFFKDEGKTKVFKNFYASSFYSLKFIYDNNTPNNVIALLFSNIEPKPILDMFFSNNSYLANRKFTEKKGKYEINYAFLPINNSGTASIWNGSGKLEPIVKTNCLNNPISEIINLQNENKLIIKKKNILVPHLAVATITSMESQNNLIFILQILFYIIAYLSLILYLSDKLLDYLIVEPVKQLANAANLVAKGSDKWELELKTGDEFESLNNSFKNLIIVLQERNILKSYVSEEAFSDIKENNNLNLLPNGEYLEATIVFSSIKDYDKSSSFSNPGNSIITLSKFMAISEEIAKKYNGSIDKVIGDTIMLVFRENANIKESHALRAAKASYELVKKSNSSGFEKLNTGIASGRVISGRIGSYFGKLDFTVIGNPVNLASRLKTESKNGSNETGIIISGTTIGLMKGKARVNYLRRVAIKGKARKYNIYELVGIRDEEIL